jgi:hypothetical protein
MLLADRVEIEGPLWLLESDDRFEPLWSAFRTALVDPEQLFATPGGTP